MNEISFNGGYLIERPSKSVWAGIKKELPKHKCIIENIDNIGNNFFSIKNIYDKDMGSLILRKNVKFKFNLKTRMDSYFPEVALKTLNEQINVINTKEELRNYIKGLKSPNVTLLKKYRWMSEDHIDKTLEAIGMKNSECETKIKSGITYIYNKNGKIIAKASPNNREGINYIYIYPKNSDDFSRRIALTQAGTIYEFSPLQYDDFLNKFMQNVKIDLGRKRPQK